MVLICYCTNIHFEINIIFKVKYFKIVLEFCYVIFMLILQLRCI